MPNHSTNFLSVLGPPDRVEEFRVHVRGLGPFFPPQFPGEGGPMMHVYEELKAGKLKFPENYDGRNVTCLECLAALMGPDTEMTDLDFNQLVPVPQEVLVKGFSDAGYHWCIEHWGTKWNAYDLSCARVAPHRMDYNFQTAWSLPIPVLDAAAERFPDLWFGISYSEESPTRGRMEWEAGFGDHVDEGDNADDPRPEYDEEAFKDNPAAETEWEELSSRYDSYFLDSHDDWVEATWRRLCVEGGAAKAYDASHARGSRP